MSCDQVRSSVKTGLWVRADVVHDGPNIQPVAARSQITFEAPARSSTYCL